MTMSLNLSSSLSKEAEDLKAEWQNRLKSGPSQHPYLFVTHRMKLGLQCMYHSEAACQIVGGMTFPEEPLIGNDKVRRKY